MRTAISVLLSLSLSLVALAASAQQKSPPEGSVCLNGPALLVTADNLVLEGHMVSVTELAGELAALQRNHKTLHPGQPWPGECLVVADAALPFSKIAGVLETLVKSGCPNVALKVKAKASTEDINRWQGRVTGDPSKKAGMLQAK